MLLPQATGPRQARYGTNHAPKYQKLVLFERDQERSDAFGILPNGDPKIRDDKIKGDVRMNWGYYDLDQCARNVKVAFDIQTGCRMGPADFVDLQVQLTSMTTAQCAVDPERCFYNKDEVSEVETGWWKSIYVCKGGRQLAEPAAWRTIHHLTMSQTADRSRR